jgi:hypothetical protein
MALIIKMSLIVDSMEIATLKNTYTNGDHGLS